MHTCHGSGSGTVRQWGVWPRTIRLASLRALFASECHVSRNANRNALTHPPPSPHALGTFPGAHQRTAQPSGESGRSGARARPRRPRANLIGECSNFFTSFRGPVVSAMYSRRNSSPVLDSSRLIMNTITAAEGRADFWTPYAAAEEREKSRSEAFSMRPEGRTIGRSFVGSSHRGT